MFLPSYLQDVVVPDITLDLTVIHVQVWTLEQLPL